MNERILELIKTKSTILFPGTDTVDCQISDIEKFAELIVRQCGYYADIFEAAGCPVDMDPTETKPSDYIKKHFGVEK